MWMDIALHYLLPLVLYTHMFKCCSEKYCSIHCETPYQHQYADVSPQMYPGFLEKKIWSKKITDPEGYTVLKKHRHISLTFWLTLSLDNKSRLPTCPVCAYRSIEMGTISIHHIGHFYVKLSIGIRIHRYFSGCFQHRYGLQYRL